MTSDEVQSMIDQSIAQTIDKGNKGAIMVTASLGAALLLLSFFFGNYK